MVEIDEWRGHRTSEFSEVATYRGNGEIGLIQEERPEPISTFHDMQDFVFFGLP